MATSHDVVRIARPSSNGEKNSAPGDPLFARAWKLARCLPGAEIAATRSGGSAIGVIGKVIANLCRVPGVLSIHCPLEMKAVLIEAG